LHPGGGGTERLPPLVGRGRAADDNEAMFVATFVLQQSRVTVASLIFPIEKPKLSDAPLVPMEVLQHVCRFSQRSALRQSQLIARTPYLLACGYDLTTPIQRQLPESDPLQSVVKPNGFEHRRFSALAHK
jgi:hypothetical protein